MSGARHHILPQFLLRGFASRVERNEFYAWTYRKDAPPFESNISKTAVERDFYGKEGEVNADDAITRDEGKFVAELERLRALPGGLIEDCTLIADFVVHLSSRTKHLRNSLIDGTDILIEKVFEYLSDPQRLQTWLIHTFEHNPELFLAELDKQFASVPEVAM